MGKAAAITLALVAGLLLAAVLEFRARLHPTPLPDTPLPMAIVFTGAFERVTLGLELLEAGQATRLLISGVNPGAGLQPETFATQFDLGQEARRARSEGRLILAPGAETTFENALESRCEIHRLSEAGQGMPGTVLLITSRHHMPRASVVLETALPGVEVLRLSPPASRHEPRRWAREFAGFLAMRGLTFLPARIWRQGEPCPADVSHAKREYISH